MPERPAPESWPETGTFSVRVRYNECDPMGVAHHASYAPWLELARTEMLRAGGISYREIESRGIMLAVTRLELRYRRPVLYDDWLDIHAKVDTVTRIKIRHSYEVRLVERHSAAPDPSDPRTPSDGICATAMTELACLDRDGRPTPMPEWMTSHGA